MNFTIPTNLKANQQYAFELVNVPAQQSGSVDRNVSETTSQVQTGGVSANTEIKSKTATGAIEDLQEKNIFSGYFKSSSHVTFASKLASMNFERGMLWAYYPEVHELQSPYLGNEFFDAFEFIETSGEKNKLLEFQADLSGNDWYQNLIFPLIYKDYPINGTIQLERKEEPLGIPPAKSVYLLQNPSDLKLTASGQPSNMAPGILAVVYNLPMEMYKDYQLLRALCANLSVTQQSPRSDYLILNSFPYIREGVYKINIRYVMPGTGRVTSTTPFAINYTINYIGK